MWRRFHQVRESSHSWRTIYDPSSWSGFAQYGTDLGGCPYQCGSLRDMYLWANLRLLSTRRSIELAEENI